jgi:hypothetical protein
VAREELTGIPGFIQAWFLGRADLQSRRLRTNRPGRDRDCRSSAATPLATTRTKPRRSPIVMGIGSLLILGLLAGALAKWLLPGNDPGGVLATMLIGVVGALLGGSCSAPTRWEASSS